MGDEDARRSADAHPPTIRRDHRELVCPSMSTRTAPALNTAKESTQVTKSEY